MNVFPKAVGAPDRICGACRAGLPNNDRDRWRRRILRTGRHPEKRDRDKHSGSTERLIERRVGQRVLLSNLPCDVERNIVDGLDCGGERDEAWNGAH
jgi:hypothetical protein